MTVLKKLVPEVENIEGGEFDEKDVKIGLSDQKLIEEQ